jgi:hypothetical protein
VLVPSRNLCLHKIVCVSVECGRRSTGGRNVRWSRTGHRAGAHRDVSSPPMCLLARFSAGAHSFARDWPPTPKEGEPRVGACPSSKRPCASVLKFTPPHTGAQRADGVRRGLLLAIAPDRGRRQTQWCVQPKTRSAVACGAIGHLAVRRRAGFHKHMTLESATDMTWPLWTSTSLRDCWPGFWFSGQRTRPPRERITTTRRS